MRTLCLALVLLGTTRAVATQGEGLWLTAEDLGVGPRTLKPLSVLRYKARLRRSRRGDPERAGLLHALAQHQHALGRAGEAQKLYRELVAEPKATHLDAAYFHLARLTMEQDAKGGRALLLRLIKQHPQSRYVPFVFLLFGEHYLRQGDCAKATPFLAKVAHFRQSLAARYAQYLTGRCQHEQGQHQQALLSFYNCLGARGGPVLPPGTAVRLEQAARAGLVEAYTPIGRPDRARLFFARAAGPDAAATMLEQLALVYDRLNRPADARRARADARASQVAPSP